MDAPYELIYHFGVPGRGEHIRLILEEAGVSYKDTASLPMDKCREAVAAYFAPEYKGEQGNPPYYAPPLFKYGDLIISQTSNILMYLGPKLGLSGSRENDIYRVNALALTALDGLSDEVHRAHHPISVELRCDQDQRVESMRSSKEWITHRLPKHLGYWQKVLESEECGQGPWLLGNTFTYADLVLYQCIDGVNATFPEAMSDAFESKKYDKVLQLWEAVAARPNIAAYLASDRRKSYELIKYEWDIYRYYIQNDVPLGES
ncbi:glutathione S-transferase protein-like protein [Daldinia bambusicola]|nr:glutathione S-transferase protein-like protein [Daldinia bambusicola]